MKRTYPVICTECNKQVGYSESTKEAFRKVKCPYKCNKE